MGVNKSCDLRENRISQIQKMTTFKLSLEKNNLIILEKKQTPVKQIFQNRRLILLNFNHVDLKKIIYFKKGKINTMSKRK